MSWESLPYEIHFHILRTLCIDIITEFKELGISVADTIDGRYVDADPAAAI
jgi:hypothetical protein